jgi:hypothetical protein
MSFLRARCCGMGLVLLIISGCQPTAEVANAPIESQIKESFPNATVVSTKSKLKHFTTVKEVKLNDNGKEVEVRAAKDGTILKVETEVALSDVPKPVADAIAAETKGRKDVEIEKVERRGTIKAGKVQKLDPPEVYYEVEYPGFLGIETEIKLMPDGTRRKH